MKLDLQDLGGGPVLAGALSGRAVLNRLLDQAAQEPQDPELILLDFSGVEVATASFLRESVLAFRDIVRGRHSAYYPVVTNANDVVREELIELLRARGDVLMTCRISEAGAVKDAKPIGELDPKQRLTFDLVHQHGEVDAGALMRDYGEREGLKSTTAWNNRLAGLAARGLIFEQSYGRAKRYRPLFRGI